MTKFCVGNKQNINKMFKVNQIVFIISRFALEFVICLVKSITITAPQKHKKILFFMFFFLFSCLISSIQIHTDDCVELSIVFSFICLYIYLNCFFFLFSVCLIEVRLTQLHNKKKQLKRKQNNRKKAKIN